MQDELAEQTLKAMSRKFSSSAKVWMRQITWLLSKGQPDAVKRTLDKAFKALPQRKHIKVRPADNMCSPWQCSFLMCSAQTLVMTSLYLFAAALP